MLKISVSNCVTCAYNDIESLNNRSNFGMVYLSVFVCGPNLLTYRLRLYTARSLNLHAQHFGSRSRFLFDSPNPLIVQPVGQQENLLYRMQSVGQSVGQPFGQPIVYRPTYLQPAVQPGRLAKGLLDNRLHRVYTGH